MKIIKKTKQFIKDHWIELTVTGLGLAFFSVYSLGGKSTLKRTSEYLNIDLKRGFAQNNITAKIKDIGFSDESMATLTALGFDSDEIVSATILIQSKK